MAVSQSRIHPMTLRSFATVALALFGAFVFIGCGLRDEGEAVSENALSPELVVPPASQVTVEPPAATIAEPPSATAKVIQEAAEEPARVNVPNRGYNSYGDPDAPITMFDFSDFL